MSARTGIGTNARSAGAAGGASSIAVVDDDALVRGSLQTALRLEGYAVRAFDDGGSFLRSLDGQAPDCVLLDVHMPERSGLDVLREMAARGIESPVIVMSGKADIPMALDAVRSGAMDFLEKPFDMTALSGRIRDILAERGGGHMGLPKRNFRGRSKLTKRELEVLGGMVHGQSCKETGDILKLSPRTVEIHRTNIIAKLGAKNAADVARIVFT